ncbi:MAG: UGSC family (seleno)protein, partial [Egibacteraceae bacterium]
MSATQTAFGTAQDWWEVPADPLALLEQAESEGWGDGLPLIPPSAERVQACCDHAGLDPEAMLGVMPPAEADVTAAKVAANAVMAGCRPEVFGVVVAALEAMLEPSFNLGGLQTTTHPVAPLVVVHGPVVDALGFNAGAGTFGPGNRANASV